MIILGIANDETASACLVKDAKVIAAASEERFTRIKMDNSWPENAISYCLDYAGITLDEVDIIAYGWSAGFNAETHLLPYFDRIVHEAQTNAGGLDIFRERIETEIEQDRKHRNEFWEFVKSNNLQGKAFAYDHHECHAYSAYSCSPFEKSLVVTADGRGDFMATTVGYVTPESTDFLYRGSSTDSFGFFYGRITGLLGYRPHRHEGKVTGLAAHGNPHKLLDRMREMIYVKEGRVYGKPGDFYRPFYTNYSDELEQLISENSKEDVAAAAQYHLEESITDLVTYWVKQTGAEYVTMAGGVFANVRVNQCIMEIPGVKNVFIQPQMGDGGLCIGAAAAYLYENGVSHIEMNDAYLGPDYDDETIEKALISASSHIQFEKMEDASEEGVKALENNEVIGFYNGRMEFGPRALCNRSIVYHCKDTTVNDWLNERMDRTEFMPFAPVTLEELAPRCYKNWKQEHIASKYMTITYNCTEEMAENCPATVHIDGTARPQIINEQYNPKMYALLKAWYNTTGGLSLINTSFNRHEEPIVNRPEEAIDALKSGMVDLLIIGNYIARKRHQEIR
ncbi:MAG TPA: carbamoyltransferase C-terminal domain-containing protein [Balneolaceae bacterium]|nr:carbamoyltransferase C-terminal domain-containing protein [Balneolaceae bacterium]